MKTSTARRRAGRTTAASLAVVLTATLATPAGAVGNAASDREPWTIEEARAHSDGLGLESQEIDLVPATEATITEPVVGEAVGPKKAQEVVPPAAGVASLRLPAQASTRAVAATGEAGGLQVGLESTDGLTGMRVENLPETTARALGAAGPVVALAPQLAKPQQPTSSRAASESAGAGPARGRVSLDVSYLAGSGDLVHRLTLQALPACAATTPQLSACREPAEVRDVELDAEAMTLSGTVTFPEPDEDPAAPDAEAASVASPSNSVSSSPLESVSETSTTMLLAAVADTSGSTGDWGATSLSPSSSWDVSMQTGSFSWSYPLRTPPVPGGLAPDLSLNYSSASLDGKVASTNNQSSQVGDGWTGDFSGYIERKYVPCIEDQKNVDGKAPNNADHDSGDLCWKSNNATLVFNGAATELVRDGNTDTWRPENDDNTVVKHATGGWNSDNDDEYWKLTTTDGTTYWFGRDRAEAGGAQLSSSWVVPVYGNHPGEPCYNATFADSRCQQTWRWNLDHVEDTSRNTMTYVYARDTNRYGYNNDDGVAPYQRGGRLTRIEYGQRSDDLGATPPARVLFDYTERCIATSDFDCAAGKLNEANAEHWPDVPQDLLCESGSSSCANVTSPVFFDRKRLAAVRTQMRVDGVWRYVDRWDLTQAIPDPGDGSNATVRLESIQHRGQGGTIADKLLPKVQFGYEQLENRVDRTGDLGPAMTRYRLNEIIGESGARTQISYSARQCTTGNLPSAPESNTMRCQPVYWTPQGSQDPILEYFHHYRVSTVTEDPHLHGSAPIVTSYAYTGGPAWHHDDNELVRPKYRTWGQLRGYARVDMFTGTSGDADAPRLHERYRYFRGMHGDKNGSGGTRSVQIDGINDLDEYAGMVREQITFDGSSVVDRTLSKPWRSAATAVDPDDSDHKAFHTGVQETITRTTAPALPGDERNTRTVTQFDSYGMPVQVTDHGDTAVSGDERCTYTLYNRNVAKNILDTVRRTETVATTCANRSSAKRPADVIADERFFYDSGAIDQAPSKGRLTARQELTRYVSGSSRYVNVERMGYNAYGQQTLSKNAEAYSTTTTYDNTGGLTRSKTVTSPDPDGSGPLTRHTQTTTFNPLWAVPTAIEDANGKTTTGEYDGLGRLVKVWEPGRVQGSDTPTTKFTYTVSTSGQNSVLTETLNHDASDYVASSVIYDGLLRQRQSQQPSASASAVGRVVTDTVYDSRGLSVVTREKWPTTGTATGNLLVPTRVVDSRIETEYDGAGRAVAETFQVGDGEKPDNETNYLPKWTTTTSYGGDRVSVDPPAGGVPTTTISDARGNTVELREYTGAGPSGTHHATTYDYDDADRLVGVTDPEGNTWSYAYDMRGRQVSADDPDKGTTSSTYDSLGNVVTSTDARGRTVAYTYDRLGRKTTLRDNSPSGAVRAKWSYDTVAKGQLTSSVRYDDGQAYTTTVTGYTDRYQPEGRTMSLPASLGAAAGDYTTEYVYTADGRIKEQVLPAAGGLGQERVTTLYSDTNAADGMNGGFGWGPYVVRADYRPTGEVSYLRTGSVYAYQQARYYETGTRRLVGVTTTQETGDPDDQLHELAHATYDYDAAGNVLSIKDVPSLGGSTADRQCFDYDWARRLTQAWTPASGDCSAGRSVGALGGAQPYWKSYSYDTIGNRTSTVLHRASGQGGGLVSTYSQPGAGQDRPHATTKVTATDDGGQVGASTFGYDAAGNLTARDVAGQAAQSLTWDREGELRTVTADDDGDGSVQVDESHEYVYSADGDRLVRTQGGTTTVYLPGQELTVTTGGVQATRYYTFAGQTVGVRTGSSFADVTSIFADHHQTGGLQIANVANTVVRRLLDPFGAPRDTAAGDPNGNSSTPGWTGDRGFIDKPADTTGLTAIGARYYDPLLGAFISVDPVMDLTDPQQWHAYTYSNANPVTWTDPTGLLPTFNTIPGAGGKPHFNTPSGQNIKPPPLRDPETVTPPVELPKPPTVRSDPGPGTYSGDISDIPAEGLRAGTKVDQSLLAALMSTPRPDAWVYDLEPIVDSCTEQSMYLGAACYDPISTTVYLQRGEFATEAAANATGIASLGLSLAAAPTAGGTVPLASATGLVSSGFSSVNAIQNLALGDTTSAKASGISAVGGVATFGLGAGFQRAANSLGGEGVMFTSFIIDSGGFAVTTGLSTNCARICE